MSWVIPAVSILSQVQRTQAPSPEAARRCTTAMSQPSVDVWDIAVVHRRAASGEGACVRCTWLSMDTAGITHAIDTYRMALLPALEEIDGFCSASLMVDPAMGRAVSSVTYASRDALVASRSAAEGLRTRTSGDIGATVTDVGEFELALAHLHVREMA